MPAEDLAKTVEDRQPDLIALSVDLASHVRAAAETIEVLRASAPGTPILVGGRPFALIPDLWKDVLGLCEKAHDDGLAVHGQVSGRPVGILQCWDGTLNPFIGRPSFEALADLDVLREAIADGVGDRSARRYEPPGRTTDRSALSFMSSSEAYTVHGERFAPFGRRVLGAVLDLIAVALIWFMGFAGVRL